MTDIQITLLTSTEYYTYKSVIPLIEKTWWLCSPGEDSFDADLVTSAGYITCSWVVLDFGVRPVLHMNLPNAKSLNSGDKIRIGSKSFTILSWERTKLIALCDEVIAERRFDTRNNDWETSELKQWLETKGLKLIF